MTNKLLFPFLISIELFVGLSALWGGYKLISTNDMGLPLEWLAGSPFASYTIPGVILIFAVGLINLSAAICLVKKCAIGSELSETAGLSLVIFEFSQLFIIQHNHFLQVIYFTIGIVILVVNYLLNKKNLGFVFEK
jgi:hypothetical protein